MLDSSRLSALSTGGGSFPLEPELPEVVVPEQKVKTSKIKQTSGGYVNVNYDNWKHMYTDEYTGEIFPSHLAHAAMIDELDYFNEHVWHVESLGQDSSGLYLSTVQMGHG